MIMMQFPVVVGENWPPIIIRNSRAGLKTQPAPVVYKVIFKVY